MSNNPRSRRNNQAPAEKPNNFSASIKRLFSELKSFHTLIIISLILASLSSILSIIAPDKLSSITDTISEGLVINTKNMEIINKNIMNSISNEQLSKTLPDILALNITKKNTNKILTSTDITKEEKEAYQHFIEELSKGDTTNLLNNLTNLSDNVLKIILPTSTYEEQEISTEEKIKLVHSLKVFLTKQTNDNTTIDIPNSIASIILPEFKVGKTTITSLDQVKFIDYVKQNL